MNTWGTKIKVSIFGESHGEGIGVVVDGIPSGTVLNMEKIKRGMERRAPGRNSFSTPRREGDEVEILSGVWENVTCGTPICGVIRNTNMRSTDYKRGPLRPGHADYTGFAKYGEAHDFRGGGHFSGRITAGLVFAGELAKQVLSNCGIEIGSHVKSIAGISEKTFFDCELNGELFERISKSDFPVMDSECGEKMKSEILKAAADRDSVGGIVECAAIGMPVGIGEPFFESLESKIASLVFSVPAVKGVEFGRGFGLSDMRGSETNDEFYTDGTSVYTKTNNNGGINGGISNGMPIVFSAALKPTPSIAKKQNTVDMEKMENCELEIKGRHDPCIVQRAAVVIESCLAIALLDLM